MLKITIFLFLITLATPYLGAQVVISSQGQTINGSNGSLQYTVGEVIISTISNGENGLTQGFHQTKWTLEVLDSVPDINVSIYPNPASEVLNIETTLYENTIFTLYDAKGRVVIEEELTSIKTAVNVAHLARGGYFLVFRNEALKLSVKTHKIIKSH